MNGVSPQQSSSLDNLHDIVVPDPISWWPPAPGWYVLFGFLFLLAVLWIIQATTKFWKNRYRRTALQTLAEIKSAPNAVEEVPHVISRVNQLLKRVALAAWPRSEVAQLAEQEWLEFLKRTGPQATKDWDQLLNYRGAAFSTKIGSQVSQKQLAEFLDAAEHWIQFHRSDASPPSSGSRGGDSA